MPASKYLTVTGVLLPDNRLVLQPGFVVDRPEHGPEDPNSSLVVEMVDDADRTLLRYRLPLVELCADGVTPAELAVLGKVPFPDGTRAVRFLRDDVLIHRIDVPQGRPTITITWDPGDSADGLQTITWDGQHPEGLALHYMVSYASRDGDAWQPLTLPMQEQQFELDLARLPGGDRCRVGVIGTDGINTTFVV